MRRPEREAGRPHGPHRDSGGAALSGAGPPAGKAGDSERDLVSFHYPGNDGGGYGAVWPAGRTEIDASAKIPALAGTAEPYLQCQDSGFAARFLHAVQCRLPQAGFRGASYLVHEKNASTALHAGQTGLCVCYAVSVAASGRRSGAESHCPGPAGTDPVRSAAAAGGLYSIFQAPD